MAHAKTAKTQQVTYGDRLRAARIKAGMSTETAARHLMADYLIDKTGEWVRRHEVGEVPEHKADAVAIVALAAIYGVKPSAISKNIAGRAGALRGLLKQGFACKSRLPMAA